MSKIAESCEEACQASSKVMPLKQIRNINGQRCDVRELWYPTFYNVHVLLGYLKSEKRERGNEAVEYLMKHCKNKKDKKFVKIQHVQPMQI